MLRPLTIRSVVLPSADADALMAGLDVELEERYPELNRRSCRLTPAQLRPGCGVFLVAHAGDVPVGCCALRHSDSSTGEIRRMYVLPWARGSGIGSRLLTETEQNAQDDGLQRLVLTTGINQPEAIGMYQRHGFARVPCPPGEATPHLRVYMTKVLTGCKLALHRAFLTNSTSAAPDGAASR